MHPIERLRYVARADGADAALVAAEAGHALAAVAAGDPSGLVPACRRLIDRHTTSGPMWWLCAQVLADPDPVRAAHRAAGAIAADTLPSVLGRALPDDATVAIVGWPGATGDALRRRGDLEVLAIDGDGEGNSLARRLSDADMAVASVSDAGAASAVVVSDLLVLEAVAAGPSGMLCRIGSHGAAAAAAHAGVPVWAVAGIGRVLPGALWDALLDRLDHSSAEPWERPVELVPAGLVTAAVGSDGPAELAAFWVTSSAPVAPELLRAVD